MPTSRDTYICPYVPRSRPPTPPSRTIRRRRELPRPGTSTDSRAGRGTRSRSRCPRCWGDDRPRVSLFFRVGETEKERATGKPSPARGGRRRIRKKNHGRSAPELTWSCASRCLFAVIAVLGDARGSAGCRWRGSGSDNAGPRRALGRHYALFFSRARHGADLLSQTGSGERLSHGVAVSPPRADERRPPQRCPCGVTSGRRRRAVSLSRCALGNRWRAMTTSYASRVQRELMLFRGGLPFSEPWYFSMD